MIVQHLIGLSASRLTSTPCWSIAPNQLARRLKVRRKASNTPTDATMSRDRPPVPSLDPCLASMAPLSPASTLEDCPPDVGLGGCGATTARLGSEPMVGCCRHGTDPRTIIRNTTITVVRTAISIPTLLPNLCAMGYVVGGVTTPSCSTDPRDGTSARPCTL